MPPLTLAALVEQFQAHNLPREQWNHHAHLGIALWTLRHSEKEEVLVQLRQQIRDYNDSIGIENGPFSGYHETITRFFALAVRHFLQSHSSEMDDDELWADLISEWGDKNLVLRYYSKRYLFSPSARAHWCEPDLKPLDF